MRVDLHVHTYHSKDSLARPADLLVWMQRRGLGAIAVTDHDAIDGALEAAALAPEAIIVGEEIATSRGEIIGLFLRERIVPGLSPRQTAELIHAQGGLVYVPHPTDHVRGSTLAEDALLAILPEVDLIEAYNARVLLTLRNRQARRLAQTHGLRMGAGSDAHRARDIGLAYVDMPPFTDASTFLASLAQGQVHGRLVGLVGRFSSLYARLSKRRSERAASRAG